MTHGFNGDLWCTLDCFPSSLNSKAAQMNRCLVGRVSVPSLLVSWCRRVSDLDSCRHRGGGKARTRTQTRRPPSAGMAARSLISDASHRRLAHRRGDISPGKMLQLLRHTELSCLQLCCHTVEGLILWLVMFGSYFSDRRLFTCWWPRGSPNLLLQRRHSTAEVSG